MGLSQRLRRALRKEHMAAGQPEVGDVVGPIDRSNYRTRHFARACNKAGLGPRRPKDLRDTFASQLLTAGVQLGYVSLQLGHSDMAVTAKHYGRWAGTEYRSPVALRNGELPCDLLARLEDTLHDVRSRSGHRGRLPLNTKPPEP